MAQRQNQTRKSSKPSTTKTPQLIHNKFGVRFAHHKHNAHHLPWRYTSYTVLFFLIAVVSLVLIFTGIAVRAYDQVGQGNVKLSGLSKGPPPKNAAVITYPASQAIFDQNIINTAGDCEPGLYIELYRNSVLAGGSICSNDGTYKIYTTLVPGKNDIQARIHDALWQYGPDSNTISVWYNVPLPPVPTLLTYTKPVQQGLLLGQQLDLEYIISGGDGPYAVSISWGDNTNPHVIIRQKSGNYTANHVYDKAGQYTIIISVTDQRDTKALIQSVVVVHSDKDPLPAIGSANGCNSSSCPDTNIALKTIDWAWPVLIIAGLMTLSFWLGEKIAATHRLFRFRIP